MLGTLAVVGPTRMDYARVIPLVDLTARQISRALAALSERIGRGGPRLSRSRVRVRRWRCAALGADATPLRHSDDKGAFQADIPVDAVEEALRAVERIADGGAAGGEVEVAPRPGPTPRRARRGGRGAEGAARALDGEGPRDAREAEGGARAGAPRRRRPRELPQARGEGARRGPEVRERGLLKDLLPVVDGLDRALAAAPPDDPLVEGVRLVRAASSRPSPGTA